MSRYAKKHKSVTYNQEKNQLIQMYPEMTKIIEFSAVIKLYTVINVFKCIINIFKDLIYNINMMRETEDIKKTQVKILIYC